jgi:crossover junction endodeoxyribonuclease RuvC
VSESSVILGVDPGSRLCGYGVIEVVGPKTLRYIECGVLSANPKDSMETRLGEIARWLTDVVTELRPTVMAVEEAFTSKNPKSALALAQARGTVLAVAGMSGLSVHSYPPTTVKKAVTGFGRASKEQVARMVQSLMGLSTTPKSDAADALAVAIAHAQQMR